MSFKITDRVLDKLGFSEYWAGSGDYSSRILTFSNDDSLEITDFDEKDDDTDGYTTWGTYQPQHFDICSHVNKKNMTNNEYYNLVFLEDLHLAIRNHWSNCEQEFVDKCTKLKMQWGLIDAKPRYGNIK